MLLNFAAKNPGMTRVLTGEALVGEHARLAERVTQMLERVEASVKQSLRIALMEAHQAQAPQEQGQGQGQEGETERPHEPGQAAASLPDDYDPIVRANLLVSYVVGRWHRYARSGFTRVPAEHAEAQLRLILQ
jgi:TetR/AcrR family transcriptional regulator